MDDQLSILVLDDETVVGQRLKKALEKNEHYVEAFVDPLQAMARLDARDFDIVVTDIRMDDMDGISLLEHVMSRRPRTKFIMITGYATLELARESLAKGAFDFIAKPFELNEVRHAIEKAREALQQEDTQDQTPA
jgi:DNA-binding NtrC family response regulator